ncbi:MAG: hypothetical protein WDN26_15440 [Chitinophagaceae bacterium]
MKKAIIKILSIIITLFPLSAFAHGYWIEVEGTHKTKEAVTIKLFYGEYESGERLSGTYLDKMGEIKVFVLFGTTKQQITMKQLADYWQGSFTPDAEGVYEITGINDERQVQDWTAHNLGIVRPVQYLKTTYHIGTNATAQHHNAYLDIEAISPAKNNYQLHLFKNDTAFTDMKITVMHPDGWIKTIFTDTKGIASFTPAGPALYLIVVEWIDKIPGIFKQKKYETLRHRLDFTLYHPQ